MLKGDANSSYIFGNDSVDGWGPRYFFTFYSQLGSRQRGIATAEVSVLSLVFLLSVVANTGIAIAVLCHREMRTVTNCFLLNLAAADIVFALGIPAVAITRVTGDWILGNVLCRVLPYSQFVCGFVLLWTLTLISMDRHRCIVVPPYRSRLTPTRATVLTGSTWLLAAVLFLPVAFWFRIQSVQTYNGNNHKICTLVFPRSEVVNISLCFTIPMIFFACLLPMALLVYHYQRIFQKILATRNRWASPCVSSENSSSPRRDSEMSFVGSIILPWSRRKISTASQHYPQTSSPRSGSLSQHEELRLNKHLRVVRILLLNVVVVLIMWLPITTIMFLIYLDGRRPTEDTNFFLRSHHFIWALLVALCNTVLNPVLYGVLSENFRACFTRLWVDRRRRRMGGEISGGFRAAMSRSNMDILQDRSSGRIENGYPGIKSCRKQSSVSASHSVNDSPNGVLV